MPTPANTGLPISIAHRPVPVSPTRPQTRSLGLATMGTPQLQADYADIDMGSTSMNEERSMLTYEADGNGNEEESANHYKRRLVSMASMGPGSLGRPRWM